jgi:outer membrane protein TolC
MTSHVAWALLSVATASNPAVPALTVTSTVADLGEREVLTSVLLFHPSIEAAIERRRAAQGELLSARGAFDPRLDVRGQTVPSGYYDTNFVDVALTQPTTLWGVEAIGGYRYGPPNASSLPSFAPYEEDLETLDGGEARVGLKIPLLQGGPIDKRRASLRKSRIAVERFDAEVRAERLDLARQSVSAYWSWRAAVAKLRVAQRLTAIARARDAAVGRRVDEGTLAPIERVEATRALRQREQAVVMAEQKVRLAAVKLSLFLRNADGEPAVPDVLAAQPLSSRVLDVGADRLGDGLGRALADRPEIEAISRKLAELDVQAELAENLLFPKLDLKGKLAKDFGTAPAGPSRTDDLEPLEIELGVSLQLPVLLRESRGQLRAARARQDELKQKFRFTRDKLVAEVERAWILLQTATESAQLAVELRDLAEEVAEGERRRFEEGAADLFTVFLRESLEGEAASKAIEALATQRAADSIFELTTCLPSEAHRALGLPAC